MVSSSGKQIDDAINRFMAMSPQDLAGYKPATNAEAIARNLIITATSSEDEGLKVRTSQLIADRTEGRATASARSNPKQEEFLKQMREALSGKGVE